MIRRQRHSLGTEAYERLRRLLIHGQLQSGIKLVESEWAKRLSVHRIAMREAMVLLAHEGLLRPGERGGFFTPILEQRDLDEIMEARSIIEIGAIRLIGARGRLDADEVKRLESVCDLMQANLDAGIELGFIEGDRGFHRAFVEMSRNQRLIDLYAHAPLPLWPSRETSPEQRRRDGQKTIDEHRRICAFLASGQMNEAIDLLERHLHTSRPTMALPDRKESETSTR